MKMAAAMDRSSTSEASWVLSDTMLRDALGRLGVSSPAIRSRCHMSAIVGSSWWRFHFRIFDALIEKKRIVI